MELDEIIKAAMLKVLREVRLHRKGKLKAHSEFAREAGLTRTTIVRFNSNDEYQLTYVRMFTWEKLYPYLEKYLPDDPKYYPRSRLIEIVNQRSLECDLSLK